MIKNLPLRREHRSARHGRPGGGMQASWTETMAGGSPEAERIEFDRLALATDRAELTFLDLPEDLRAGFAQPGRTYPTVVRFSNASPTGQPDFKQDLRGMALRVQVSPEESHDLLATNFPVS